MQLLYFSNVAHGAPQLVCLRRRVSTQLHGDRHRLFLEDRNSLGALENRFQVWMWVGYRLEPAPSRRVWMDEIRLDRARTNQCHLHHDVIQPIRLRMQHRSDLRPALDLERANRLTAGDEIVGRLVIRRQLVHLGTSAGAHLDHVEGASHQRQRAESQEIELGNTDGIEIVLVELDDRATHRRVLDRQIVAEQRRG